MLISPVCNCDAGGSSSRTGCLRSGRSARAATESDDRRTLPRDDRDNRNDRDNRDNRNSRDFRDIRNARTIGDSDRNDDRFASNDFHEMLRALEALPYDNYRGDSPDIYGDLRADLDTGLDAGLRPYAAMLDYLPAYARSMSRLVMDNLDPGARRGSPDRYNALRFSSLQTFQSIVESISPAQPDFIREHLARGGIVEIGVGRDATLFRIANVGLNDAVWSGHRTGLRSPWPKVVERLLPAAHNPQLRLEELQTDLAMIEAVLPVRSLRTRPLAATPPSPPL